MQSENQRKNYAFFLNKEHLFAIVLRCVVSSFPANISVSSQTHYHISNCEVWNISALSYEGCF